MFLTQGETKRYPPYVDELTNSTTAAVKFAIANDFLVRLKFLRRNT